MLLFDKSNTINIGCMFGGFHNLSSMTFNESFETSYVKDMKHVFKS